MPSEGLPQHSHLEQQKCGFSEAFGLSVGFGLELLGDECLLKAGSSPGCQEFTLLWGLWR